MASEVSPPPPVTKALVRVVAILGIPQQWLSYRSPDVSDPGEPVDKTGHMLLIDAANVIGSRPNGWWRDRPGAARTFVHRVRAAVASGVVSEPVVVVLEGAARRGAAADVDGGVTVLHAPGSGDDTLVAVAVEATGQVTLVSADRALGIRAQAAGAEVVSPSWLIDRLDG